MKKFIITYLLGCGLSLGTWAMEEKKTEYLGLKKGFLNAQPKKSTKSTKNVGPNTTVTQNIKSTEVTVFGQTSIWGFTAQELKEIPLVQAFEKFDLDFTDITKSYTEQTITSDLIFVSDESMHGNEPFAGMTEVESLSNAIIPEKNFKEVFFTEVYFKQVFFTEVYYGNNVLYYVNREDPTKIGYPRRFFESFVTEGKEDSPEASLLHFIKKLHHIYWNNSMYYRGCEAQSIDSDPSDPIALKEKMAYLFPFILMNHEERNLRINLVDSWRDQEIPPRILEYFPVTFDVDFYQRDNLKVKRNQIKPVMSAHENGLTIVIQRNFSFTNNPNMEPKDVVKEFISIMKDMGSPDVKGIIFNETKWSEEAEGAFDSMIEDLYQALGSKYKQEDFSIRINCE